jgi:hypothetical protein
MILNIKFLFQELSNLCKLFTITELASYVKVKGEAIPITGRGGPEGCETSKLSHFLDSRLTGGGEIVSLTRGPPFTPQKDYWYLFPLQAESIPGP